MVDFCICVLTNIICLHIYEDLFNLCKVGGSRLKAWRQRSILYLLQVAPLLGIGDILQGLYGHELCLVHARQIQVTLVYLP